MSRTPKFYRSSGLYGIKRGTRPGGRPLIQGPLISKKTRKKIKKGVKKFTSGVKDLFSGDNIGNKYASVNYLARNSKKAINKKDAPSQSVTALNQGSNKFQSDATALQSDAQSRQIYGGTAAQRQTASGLAATNATDALFATGSTQNSGFQKFGDYGFKMKRGGKVKDKYSQYD